MTVKNGLYRHYKGNMYKVTGIARHSETEEEMVVYQALYGDYVFWVRPKAMFMESVVINGEQMPRFAYVSALEDEYVTDKLSITYR